MTAAPPDQPDRDDLTARVFRALYAGYDLHAIGGIERSARDTFNALKLEKKLSREGFPLFATDEPASIEGINATTVLVRRVKQGAAEWFRLQLKEKAWKGLQEHSLAGWNIGFPPYRYAVHRVAAAFRPGKEAPLHLP